MLTIIAYVLVVPLVQLCLTIGVLIASFAVAFILAWAPVSLRTNIAGILGGVFGVAAAVGFGYGVFRILVGPGSFTFIPFLASTVPLFIPIWNDLQQAKRVGLAHNKVLTQNDTERVAKETKVLSAGSLSLVIGDFAGLVLAGVWFFNRS